MSHLGCTLHAYMPSLHCPVVIFNTSSSRWGKTRATHTHRHCVTLLTCALQYVQHNTHTSGSKCGKADNCEHLNNGAVASIRQVINCKGAIVCVCSNIRKSVEQTQVGSQAQSRSLHAHGKLPSLDHWKLTGKSLKFSPNEAKSVNQGPPVMVVVV